MRDRLAEPGAAGSVECRRRRGARGKRIARRRALLLAAALAASVFELPTASDGAIEPAGISVLPADPLSAFASNFPKFGSARLDVVTAKDMPFGKALRVTT